MGDIDDDDSAGGLERHDSSASLGKSPKALPGKKKKMLRRRSSETSQKGSNPVKQLSTITIMYSEENIESRFNGANGNSKEPVRPEEQARREVIAFSPKKVPFMGLQMTKSLMEKQSILLDLGDDPRLEGLHGSEVNDIVKRFRENNMPINIDKQQFGDAMKTFRLTDKPVLDRLYAVFDPEDTGLIDWRDLCASIAMFRPGEPDEKLERVWKVWQPFRSDGDISKDDLQKLFKSACMATEGKAHAALITDMIYRVEGMEDMKSPINLKTVRSAIAGNAVIGNYVKQYLR